MNYRPREGIVPVNICGARLLVPTRRASEQCPNIASLSTMEFILWRQFEKGKTMEEICGLYSAFTLKSREVSMGAVETFAGRMCERGFLLPDVGEKE